MWEKIDFKYSLEHILLWSMNKIVGKEYVPNSRKFVYGPAEELEEGESKELMWCIEINENNLQISTTVVFVVC